MALPAMLEFARISMSAIAEKSEVARKLADAHRQVEPGIVHIVRLLAEHELDIGEPVKLLEVNRDTSPSGVVPIAFGAAPPSIPFPSVVVEVTEGEFEQIRSGSLPLPEGWRLGDILFSAAA